MCVWFYDMKLSVPVYIVFIVHIVIYIVGDKLLLWDNVFVVSVNRCEIYLILF